MKPRITTQRKLRREFWATFPALKRMGRQGYYPTDTRVAFCDWIDGLARDGSISEVMAQKATL